MKKTSIIIGMVAFVAMLSGCDLTDGILETVEDRVRKEINDTMEDVMDGISDDFGNDYQGIMNQIGKGIAEIQSKGDDAGLWDASGGTYEPALVDERDRIYRMDDGTYIEVFFEEDGTYSYFKQYSSEDELMWNCDWPFTWYDELHVEPIVTSCDEETHNGYETALYVNVTMRDPVESDHRVFLNVSDEVVTLYHIDRITGTNWCPDMYRINTQIYNRFR